MANKICDFCLEETKGLFKQPETIQGGYHICRKCRKIIEDYGLPVKYDLFQLLVTADPSMHEMMMGDYLENHKAEDTIAKYFPLPNILLHDGEHCINMRKASINVSRSLIPSSLAVTAIADICRPQITNLSDAADPSDAVKADGMLYETDAAVYFLSEHFINCHRLTSLIKENQPTDAVHVLEHNRRYTYYTPHSDLFFMRETFYRMAAAAKENKKKNLIYLASENTMTLTSGIYNVPKNIRAGNYWVNPVNDSGLSIRDANGRYHEIRGGRLHIDEGSTLEVTGEYEFRFTRREPKEPDLKEE